MDDGIEVRVFGVDFEFGHDVSSVLWKTHDVCNSELAIIVVGNIRFLIEKWKSTELPKHRRSGVGLGQVHHRRRTLMYAALPNLDSAFSQHG